LLTCCFIVSPVVADELWHSSVIFSAGYAKEQNACAAPWLSIDMTGGTCSEKQRVYRFAYNYHFTPIWGLEISYGDLAKSEAFGTSLTSGEAEQWNMKSSGWAIAGTGTLPIRGKLSLLGKIGGVRAEFDENIYTTFSGVPYYGLHTIRCAKNALTYGIGLQYDFNATYALRAQYENFGKYDLTSPLDGSTFKVSLSQISAGLVLKF
jgi:opacity protein-like surface antigen